MGLQPSSAYIVRAQAYKRMHTLRQSLRILVQLVCTTAQSHALHSTLELENRVRVLTMRISLSNSHGGAAAGDSLGQSSNHWGRARSLSPGRAGVWAAANAEVVETHAQMAVIADATNTVS